MLNEVPKNKLEGFGVARAVLQEVNFVKSANHKASNFMRQAQFLPKLLKQLEEKPQSVIDDLNKLNALITTSEAILIQVNKI